MDVATEPIIVVIGHPIAGNPSQFAVERALRSLDLDWRVLSFDVNPEDVAAALEGFAVTGIKGVMIAPSVCQPASDWYAKQLLKQKAEATEEVDATQDASAQTVAEPASPEDAVDGASAEPSPIDCLARASDGRFVGTCEQGEWLEQQIAKHAESSRVLLGQAPTGLLGDVEGLANLVTSDPNPERIAEASLILVGTSEDELTLETDDWNPADDSNGSDASKVVIDLTDGHAELPTIRRLGYQVVGSIDRHIGTLQRCLERWTGKQASAEVLHEAIEEYLGV